MTAQERDAGAAARLRHPRALLAAIGVALGIGIAELGASVALHFLEAPPELPPEVASQVSLAGRLSTTIPDPYLSYRVAPNYETRGIRTNSFGLRGGPIDPVPAPDVFRVLWLGGSTAWGYTATSDDETPAAELQRALAAHPLRAQVLGNWRVEVLNGGVPGYVAWQSALLYDLRYRPLGAHAVVSLDGSNDISGAIHNREAGAPMRYVLTKRLYLRENPELLRGILDWALHRLHRSKVGLLFERLSPPSVSALGAPPPAEVARAYADALSHLGETARAEGAVALGVFQPVSHLVDGKPLDPFEQAVNEHEERDMPGRGAYYRDCASAIRAEFERLRREEPELLLLDATSAFDGAREIAFTDPAHLTPAGNRLLARAVADALLRGLIDRAK
jgi:lysophospholipase L1-like esterase